jgi:hypothetical protein
VQNKGSKENRLISHLSDKLLYLLLIPLLLVWFMVNYYLLSHNHSVDILPAIGMGKTSPTTSLDAKIDSTN